MANTLMRNFRKPADKLKAKMTTDEMIAMQIANDANTATARKAIHLGIMPTILPEEVKTLEEDLLNITKQEQNARRNLQEIGFKPDVVQNILTMLSTYEADPAILVKFNPNLITADFFMDYLVRYTQQIDATRGLIPIGQGGNHFNAVIDNPAELREVLITRGQSYEIVGRLSNEFRGNPVLNDVVENLRDLKKNLPDTRIINRLNELLKTDRVQGVASLQDIANALSNLPTRDQLEQILQKGSIDEILRALEGVSGEIINRLEEINSNLGITDVKDGYIPQDEGEPIPEAEVSMGSQADISMGDPEMITAVLPNGDRKPLYVGLTPRGKIVFLNDDDSMVHDKKGLPLFMTLKLRDAVRDLGLPYGRDNMVSGYGEEAYRYFEGRNPVLRPRLDKSTTYLAWDFFKSTLGQIEELIKRNQGTPPSAPPPPLKEGKGLLGKRRVGSGISYEEKPRYVEFGKYCIHLGQLEKDDLLNVKYLKTNATIPKFPPTAVSEQLKDFLIDLIERGTANTRTYSKIPPEERKLFQEISMGAGVFAQLNLPKTTLDNDALEEKRFEILRGEWIAGNNAPMIIKELRKLIMKFMSVGKINRRTGKNLLIDIA